MSDKHDILKDTMCLYCSGRKFDTPEKLQRHIDRKHPNTYAYWAVKKAKERERES